MNIFERILYWLQGTMPEPQPFGLFHIFWIILSFCCVFLLYKKGTETNEKQLKTVLGIYGIVALLLEITKQLIWTFNFDPSTNIVTWDYSWYAAPFQLCTTPIYVSIICLFLKNNKIRDSLLSYIAYFTILGSIMTMILPESCFVEDILVNIHTMWLHCGSFVVSIFLLMNGYVKVSFKSFKRAFLTFLAFVGIALLLNIGIYNWGILGTEEFNMFYISPYFISSLPVFSTIQELTPYPFYLIIYIFALFTGALIVFYAAKIINKIAH